MPGTGSSAAWQRATFGTWRPGVQIPPSRLNRATLTLVRSRLFDGSASTTRMGVASKTTSHSFEANAIEGVFAEAHAREGESELEERKVAEPGGGPLVQPIRFVAASSERLGGGWRDQLGFSHISLRSRLAVSRKSSAVLRRLPTFHPDGPPASRDSLIHARVCARRSVSSASSSM